MIDFNKIFETDQVRLRPLKPEDKDAFLKITSGKDLWTYFTSDLSNKNVLSDWVDNGINQMKNKTRLALAIIAKQDNKIVGSTSLINISVLDKRIEIGGTWICRDYQGKRINDQSKYLLLKYCFGELEFERVEFKTDVLNNPARKALLRIGAKEEGILRSHTLMTNNRRRDTIYYSILKPEWKEIKMKNNWL